MTSSILMLYNSLFFSVIKRVTAEKKQKKTAMSSLINLIGAACGVFIQTPTLNRRCLFILKANPDESLSVALL